MRQVNKLFRHLDSGILIATLLLIVGGLIAIYSATYAYQDPSTLLNFKRQLIWVFFGFLIFGISILVPIRIFHKYAYHFYVLMIILLLLVLIIGKGTGAKRWISLGAFWIQPAEFAKVGTLLALSKWLSQDNRDLKSFRDLAVTFALIFLPGLLILRQPDLGSALVFFVLIVPMLHWAGLSSIALFVLIAPLISLMSAFNYYSFLIAMILICLVLLLSQKGLRFFLINFIINIGVGILTPVFWNFLQEYQQKRILTFLGLVADPRGLDYQVIQSKVAIGSGGFFGNGFLQGTQTHLRFLPEQHTDFIFSVIGEEFGFLGVTLVLGLFLYILLRAISLAANVKSKFSSLLIIGTVSILSFQIFVNVGMTVGIMPVTGLPLPFLSYGGSSLLTYFILIGLILNASLRRFEYL
jgi:rod shape determining protein RodA